ncbi:hypothetical protein EV121DRAFT_274177 [Schizophyllum commune]
MDQLARIQATYKDKVLTTHSPLFPGKYSLRDAVVYYGRRRTLQPDEVLGHGCTTTGIPLVFTITDDLLRPLQDAVCRMQSTLDALHLLWPLGKRPYQVDPRQGFLALLCQAPSLEELHLAWVGIANRMGNAGKAFEERYDQATRAGPAERYNPGWKGITSTTEGVSHVVKQTLRKEDAGGRVAESSPERRTLTGAQRAEGRERRGGEYPTTPHGLRRLESLARPRKPPDKPRASEASDLRDSHLQLLKLNCAEFSRDGGTQAPSRQAQSRSGSGGTQSLAGRAVETSHIGMAVSVRPSAVSSSFVHLRSDVARARQLVTPSAAEGQLIAMERPDGHMRYKPYNSLGKDTGGAGDTVSATLACIDSNAQEKPSDQENSEAQTMVSAPLISRVSKREERRLVTRKLTCLSEEAVKLEAREGTGRSYSQQLRTLRELRRSPKPAAAPARNPAATSNPRVATQLASPRGWNIPTPLVSRCLLVSNNFRVKPGHVPTEFCCLTPTTPTSRALMLRKSYEEGGSVQRAGSPASSGCEPASIQGRFMQGEDFRESGIDPDSRPLQVFSRDSDAEGRYRQREGCLASPRTRTSATHDRSPSSLHCFGIVGTRPRPRPHMITKSTSAEATSKRSRLARAKSFSKPTDGAGGASSRTLSCGFDAGGQVKQYGRATAGCLKERLRRHNDLTDDIGNSGSQGRREHIPSESRRAKLAWRSEPRCRRALETVATGEFDSGGRSEQGRCAIFASHGARRVLDHGLGYLVSKHDGRPKQKHAPFESHRHKLTGDVPKPGGRHAAVSSRLAQAKSFRVLEIGESEENLRAFSHELEDGGRVDRCQYTIVVPRAARTALEGAHLANLRMPGEGATSLPRLREAGGRAMRAFCTASDSADVPLRLQHHCVALEIDTAGESGNTSSHDCEAVGRLDRGQLASPEARLVRERGLPNVRNDIGHRAMHLPRDSNVRGRPMLITRAPSTPTDARLTPRQGQRERELSVGIGRTVAERHAPEITPVLRKTATVDIRMRGESYLDLARDVGECQWSQWAGKLAIKRLGGELPKLFVDLPGSQGRDLAAQEEFDVQFLEQLDQPRNIEPDGPTASISRPVSSFALPTHPLNVLLALRPTECRMPRLSPSASALDSYHGKSRASKSQAFQPPSSHSWFSLPSLGPTDMGGVSNGLNSQRALSPPSPHCELGGSRGWYPLPDARRARQARHEICCRKFNIGGRATRRNPRREEGTTSVSEQRSCSSLDPTRGTKFNGGREEDATSAMQKGTSAALTRTRSNLLWPRAPGQGGCDECQRTNRAAHEREPPSESRGVALGDEQVKSSPGRRTRCTLIARREVGTGSGVRGEEAATPANHGSTRTGETAGRRAQ